MNIVEMRKRQIYLQGSQIACELLNHRFVAASVCVLIENEANVKDVLVSVVFLMVNENGKATYAVISHSSSKQIIESLKTSFESYIFYIKYIVIIRFLS